MKINRKKFFISAAAASFFGFSFVKKFPFELFGSRSKNITSKINVKINPSAVSRHSEEDNHA